MKHILLFIILFTPLASIAGESLCPVIKSRGEGHWPIPEKAFTESNAKSAIKSLSLLINANISEVDDFISKQNNNFIKIKGYNYLRYLNDFKSKHGQYDVGVLKEFCKFMETEAFSWH